MHSTIRYGSPRKKSVTIRFETLLQAKPENVLRLARAIGIQANEKDHRKACLAVVRWYKRNPQPNPKNR